MATILVLEDEPMVRAVFLAVLTKDAHCVLEAADAQSALAACLNPDHQIDAIVADVTERGSFDGAVAREMFALRPGVPMLLVSGYSLCDLIQRQFISPKNLELGKVVFLEKPFWPHLLRHEIRRLLAEPAAKSATAGDV